MAQEFLARVIAISRPTSPRPFAARELGRPIAPGEMARARSAILALVLLAAAALCALTFVAPGDAARTPSVTMQARGGAAPPKPAVDGPVKDPTALIYGLTVFAWLSTIAQLRGFFNPDAASM
uniref:Uncharacterized protein n=1 Tax=Zooxanthella nutricula TaxID=1333877 RepID=A0A7S2NJG4_9DINO